MKNDLFHTLILNLKVVTSLDDFKHPIGLKPLQSP